MAPLIFSFSLLALFTNGEEVLGQEPPLSKRLQPAVSQAQTVVEKIRGVSFKSTVASVILPESQLPAVLSKKLMEDLPAPFPKYTASLAAIGLIDPVPDLEKRILNLYSRQVAGFYDPAERKFYIVKKETKPALPEGTETAGMGPIIDEALLVHELTHALQDQRLGLSKLMKKRRDNTDALLALQAFLEGEATLVMTEAILQKLPSEMRDGTDGDFVAAMTSNLANAGTISGMEGASGVPDFLVEELVFPYASGTKWVQAKRGKGGWRAVEDVYLNLPQTSKEILNPGKPPLERLTLAPTERPEPGQLPRGLHFLYSDTLGEWVLGFLVNRAGGGDSSRQIASTWQDDRILFFEPKKASGLQIGFLWRIKCASSHDATNLAAALAPLYSSRPFPARPVLSVRGDVVEISRGLPDEGSY